MNFLFVCGHPDYLIGGAEVQALRIANQLVLMGHRVVFLCPDAKPGFVQKEEGIGIQFYKKFRSLKIRDCKTLTHEMKRLDFDACYIRATPFAEAGAVRYCVKKNPPVPVIWHCPSGRSLIRFSTTRELLQKQGLLKILKNLPDALSADCARHYSIRRSDEIIIQTDANHEILLRNFKRQGTKVLKGIRVPVSCPEKRTDGPIQVCFVRNIRERSRLHYFLDMVDIIVHNPDLKLHFRFHVIGKYQIRDNHRLMDRMNSLGVSYHGAVSNQEVAGLFRESHVLVDTLQEMEGQTTYSTTFIEAWSAAMVILAFDADPDNVLRNGLGFRPESVSEAAAILTGLHQNRQHLIQLGIQGFEYVRKFHAIENEAQSIVNLASNHISKNWRPNA